MSFIRAEAVTGFTFGLVAKTTGAALTGAASGVGKFITKDGGTQASIAGSIAEEGNGLSDRPAVQMKNASHTPCPASVVTHELLRNRPRLGHLRPAYQITTRSAWLDPTTGPPGKGNGYSSVGLFGGNSGSCRMFSDGFSLASEGTVSGTSFRILSNPLTKRHAPTIPIKLYTRRKPHTSSSRKTPKIPVAIKHNPKKISVLGEVRGFKLNKLAITFRFVHKTICHHPLDCHWLLKPDNHCVELCGITHFHTREEQVHTHHPPLLMCA